MIRPVSPGKISHGTSCVKAKNSRSQWARYSCHFWSARRSSTEDLISTIQISPRSFSATRSARRPDGSGNSLTQENPSERNSRAVPRAIASAVSDWRPSGAGTRLIWRTCDSIAASIERRQRKGNGFARCGNFKREPGRTSLLIGWPLTTMGGPIGTPLMIDDLWYKNGVFYCLSVGTYMDANGDGVGDFKGLLRRLDYLHGLGITTIWLMPFQPSPGKDDGYDISDYYNVDPRYGTLGDFVEFTHGCKQRGIRVIIDLVVNHTSNEHHWFTSARSDKDSPFRDWYVWAARKPAGANKGMVFPGVQTSTWTHDKEAGAWYFHRFYDFQPDLNTSHPLVQAEILKIMGFWIQLGV